MGPRGGAAPDGGRGGGQLSAAARRPIERLVERLVERLGAAAEAFAPGASARLVLPGDASFVCLADECGALCCRAPYRVDLDAAEAARLIPLTEIEERGAVALLAQDAEGACGLLTAELRCGAYEARPRGCRQYPYMLHFEGAMPLLMRDPACPGFVGPPLSPAEWGALVYSIWQLQGGRT